VEGSIGPAPGREGLPGGYRSARSAGDLLFLVRVGTAAFGEATDGGSHLEADFRFAGPLVLDRGRLRWTPFELAQNIIYVGTGESDIALGYCLREWDVQVR